MAQSQSTAATSNPDERDIFREIMAQKHQALEGGTEDRDDGKVDSDAGVSSAGSEAPREEGAAPPAAEAPPADAGSEAAAPSEPDKPTKPWRPGDEELNELPDSLREKVVGLADLAHSNFERESALYGRVAPMQRLVEQLRRQNADLTSKVANLEQRAQREVPAPTLDDLENEDAFKDVLSELPEEGAKVRELFARQASAYEQKLTQATEQHEGQLAEVRNEFIARENERLHQAVPDLERIKADAHFQQWYNYHLTAQVDPQLVALLRSNFHDDTARAIDRWRAERGGEFAKPQGQAGGSPAATTSAVPHAGQPAPHQGHQQAPAHAAPPPPVPPSQGSGVSGTQLTPQRAKTERQLFREEMERRRKQHRR